MKNRFRTIHTINFLALILLLAGVAGWQRTAYGQRGGDPLWQAAFNGDLEGVKSSVEHGANVSTPGPGGFSPLVAAARNGHFDVVKYLVEHGAEVDQKNNSRDKTALLAASFKGHFDIVQYLVEKGANVNAQAINGYTPLADAADVGDIAIVKFLVEHGADPRIADHHGMTPRQNAQQALQRYDRREARGNVHGSREDFQQVISYLKEHGG